VTYQVAVAGWHWYQSIEEIGAVRMVLDRGWQWQYWLRWRTNYQCLSHIPSIANLFFFIKTIQFLPKSHPIPLNFHQIFAQFLSNFTQISSNPIQKFKKNASIFPISQ
jgi:hypothetical protein